jgi:hypothetical protein
MDSPGLRARGHTAGTETSAPDVPSLRSPVGRRACADEEGGAHTLVMNSSQPAERAKRGRMLARRVCRLMPVQKMAGGPLQFMVCRSRAR